MDTWTVEDFITYLYHIVAESDFKTVDTELEVVKQLAKNTISKHFGNPNYNYEAALKKIQSTEGVSLIHSIEVIKSQIVKYDFSKEVKSDIYNDLNEIAIADDKLTESELETLNFIKRTLQATQMPLSW